MAVDNINFERVATLIMLHKTGEITSSDQDELDTWLKKDQENQLLFEELYSKEHVFNEVQTFRSFDTESSLKAFHKRRNRKSAVKMLKRMAAAAILILVTGMGLFFFNIGQSNHSSRLEKDAALIAPGGPGATLVLSNGQKIKLSDEANGQIATESGISIVKTVDGKLVYDLSGPSTETNKQNTIYTDKGETYQLKLPDGSLVWLNAASSLTYNTALNHNGKRLVELKGEAYFEVFKDKQHPFVVKTERQEVEVLGTHFDVNSYSDEAVVKTILLEGSVRINNKWVLKPNEQASLYQNGAVVVAAAGENAVGWKDGDFVFEKENIESIMRKVARWYHVEIVYQGERPKELYSGITKRSGNVAQILAILEETGTVKFKINGNQIILSKNN